MATSIGTIPENFPITGVYTSDTLAELPRTLTGRRATFEELIWDADGGFTENWVSRSSVSGDSEAGFVFVLSRRAFSVAGLALYTYTGDEGGGGGDGNATSIQTIPVSETPPDDGQILEYDGDTNTIVWVDPSVGGGGSGDVVGPASAVNNNIAVFDSTTGKLIKDGGQTIAQVLTAPARAVYSGGSFTPNEMRYVSGAWTGCISAVFSGSWTDEVQTNITRSGENFTVALAGVYNVSAFFPSFTTGTPPLRGMRCKVNGTTVASMLSYGGSPNGVTSDTALTASLVLAASDVVTFEYINVTATTSFGAFTNNQMGGVNIKTAQVHMVRVAL